MIPFLQSLLFGLMILGIFNIRITKCGLRIDDSNISQRFFSHKKQNMRKCEMLSVNYTLIH